MKKNTIAIIVSAVVMVVLSISGLLVKLTFKRKKSGYD